MIRDPVTDKRPDRALAPVLTVLGRASTAFACLSIALGVLAATAASADPAISGLRIESGELRTADEPTVLQHGTERFMDNMMSGGPPPDGIPSIDDPHFVTPAEADLDDGDPVIGLAWRGAVRAYPHRILVQHEIVNDRVDGDNLAVTYCPLTATAQAFRTGSATLGVSGRLINSNLVMYDRDTGSLWPQIIATAIAGELKGQRLDEIDVAWTTWGEWRHRHPDTRVLSDRTGFARNYDRDPYGEYNPVSGYYGNSRVIFPVLHSDNRLAPKHMVAGARTAGHAVYFDLEALAQEGLQQTDRFIAVYDPALNAARIYKAGDGARFAWNDGRVENRDTGETHAPDELPLASLPTVEAFYFAWNAFYPDSEHP